MLPTDLPNDLPTFIARFGTDAACREHLFWLRWPDGFRCAECRGARCYAHDKRIIYECSNCGKQHSLLAGTIFEQTKTGLSKWFLAIYLVTTSKGGISAAELKRQLGFGSNQTPWVWLHKIRRAMVRPDRKPLTGSMEIDEVVLGGPRPGKRGRGAAGKSLVACAVETRTLVVQPKLQSPPLSGHGTPLRGIAKHLAERLQDRAKATLLHHLGRVRLAVIPNASGATLAGFVEASVAIPATITTDGHRGYRRLVAAGHSHAPVNLAKSDGRAHEYLPAVHLIASLIKRWLIGTHHGAVSTKHLQRYLEEYVFRFNRRTAKSFTHRCRRLLEAAVETGPATYWDITGKINPRLSVVGG